MYCMYELPARIQRLRLREPGYRALAGLRQAVAHFLHLFGNVDVDRHILRVHSLHQLVDGRGSCGAQRVDGNAGTKQGTPRLH